jgi:3'-5' exoribonuclease
MSQAPAMSTDSSRRYLSDLGSTEPFEGLFTIVNAQLGTTRGGKPYLRCLLKDRTLELPARMWNCPPELFRKLPTDGFVYAEGETQPYQGELQLILHSIRAAEPTAEQLRELLPSSPRAVDEMFQELSAALETVEHPAMRALVQTYLNDETLMEAFRQAPAAKMMHHAYLGGLLEHTLQVVNLAMQICPLYPKINRDVVVVGLFLHDLGKTRELAWDRGFDYTDRGLLVGHIVEGAIMLHDKAQQVMRETGQRLPANALTVLQHIILSHHTEPEYGAAKRPSTPEATLVALIDNLDAKTTIALDAARPDAQPALDLGGNFTEKQWALDGVKVFRPDPLD